MKRFLILIFPLFMLADDKVEKILNYKFSIELGKIYSPFYKRSIIKRDLKKKDNKKTVVKRKNIVRYKYKLLSIMAKQAKVRVTKYINNSISNIEYVCLHKGVFLNGCEVKEVGNYYVKLQCNDKIKFLKLNNAQIPYLKEIK